MRTLAKRGTASATPRRRIIDLLRARGPLSRVELARITHLNKPNISAVVARMIADGTVLAIGAGMSTGAGRSSFERHEPGGDRRRA